MFGLFDSGSSGDEAVRLRRVERKLDLILKHLGIDDPGDVGLDDEVRRLAAAGEKIAAIKAYRERTGAGLAVAKRAVEEYMRARPGQPS